MLLSLSLLMRKSRDSRLSDLLMGLLLKSIVEARSDQSLCSGITSLTPVSVLLSGRWLEMENSRGAQTCEVGNDIQSQLALSTLALKSTMSGCGWLDHLL